MFVGNKQKKSIKAPLGATQNQSKIKNMSLLRSFAVF
jgi:hypothetical protein